MTTDETAVEQVRKEKNYGMLMPREEAQVSMVYEHLGVAGALLCRRKAVVYLPAGYELEGG